MSVDPARENTIDGADRLRAVTERVPCTVVTAGAGTGKTALLVERALHRLLDLEEPVLPEAMAAITFTKKAAGEMRSRLREALLAFAASSHERTRPESDLLREIYSRILDQNGGDEHIDALHRRIVECLRDLERAPITTIHGFAALLLRSYPAEAGLGPGFKEDEGDEFDALFDSLWPRWLRGEWSSDRRNDWPAALADPGLGDLTAMAQQLCREKVDLEDLERAANDPGFFDPPRRWIEQRVEEAARLYEKYAGEKPLKLEKQLAAARRVLSGDPEEGDADLLEKAARPGTSKPWEDEDVRRAKSIVSAAGRIMRSDAGWFVELTRLLLPFVERFRAAYTEAGWISFDGLLVKARDLIRNHPQLREELKRKYRILLVDEFQDTDPLQYEIVTLLSEEPGETANDWREVRLEPGKLFIVGDPKQSIYAFRGADIRAFHSVIDHLAENPARLRLNFRSRQSLLEGINDVFSRLIVEREGLQPPYQPITSHEVLRGEETRIAAEGPADPRGEETRRASEGPADPPIEIHWVGDAEGGLLSDQGAEAEAAEIARWIRTHIAERGRPLGEVALLLRTTTRLPFYVEALREAGLRAIVEGQRSFFTTSEITGLLNLARCVAFPQDRISLLGVLRSSVGGLTDREIMALADRGALDYRTDPSPEVLEALDRPGDTLELFRILRSLYVSARSDSVFDTVRALFETFSLLPLAAISIGRDQAYGNLCKIRRLLIEWGSRPGATFAGVVRHFARQVGDLSDEGESPLAEEDGEAVKILTMHKAKGLEFPVVIIPGIGAGSRADSDRVQFSQDWSTGAWGARLGDRWTPSGAYLDEERKHRESMELRRLLYVAATRARRKILFFGSPTKSGGGETLLGVLKEAFGEDLACGGPGFVSAGETSIPQSTTAPLPLEPETDGAVPDSILPPEALSDAWVRDEESHRSAAARRLRVSPSALAGEAGASAPLPEAPEDAEVRGDRARRVGTLAHAVLERLDYASGAGRLADAVAEAARRSGETDVTIPGEVEEMLAVYLESDAFRRISSAEILRREVPFLDYDEERQAAVEGVIDLIYRDGDGDLVVADFKSDRVTGERDAGEHAERYREQGGCYLRAVSRGLGEDVRRFELHFLRIGTSIGMEV